MKYLTNYVCNSDVVAQILRKNGSALQEWFNEDDTYLIRYTVDVDWPQSTTVIFEDKTVSVTEQRTVDRDAGRISVSSQIKTDLQNLTGEVTRIITDVGTNCREDITIIVEWDGQTYKEDIESAFFAAFQRLVTFNDGPVWEKRPSSPKAVSPEQLQEYHAIHERLEELVDLSGRFLETINMSEIDRTQCPLVLPSVEQISEIAEMVHPMNFTIKGDIDEMRSEMRRTQRIMEQVKRTREQTTHTNVFPMFVLASLTAVVFIVVSKNSRR